MSKENKKDFRAILAVGQSGDVFIVDYTPDCDEADLLVESDYAADNDIIPCKGMEDIGLYHVRLKPWSYRDYEGDYECGIDCELLGVLYQPTIQLGDNNQQQAIAEGGRDEKY